ncbi:MAG: hypothetical protein WKF47_18930 [Geodermatophilaceae bacterium]
MIAAPETFTTRVEADRWLASKRADLDRGQVVDDRAGMQALEAWWPGYFAGTVRLKQSTRVAYETAWRLRVRPRFGSVPVRRIRASHVEDWLADLHEQGVSSSKAIEAYGVLNRVLNRAVRDQALPANPCGQRSMPLPRRPFVQRPVLSPVEVEALAAAMARSDNGTLVRLLAYGGLRIGEALALQCGDLDPASGTLRIERSAHEIAGVVQIGPTKTYSGRTITLPSSLAEELVDVAAERVKASCCSRIASVGRADIRLFVVTPGTRRRAGPVSWSSRTTCGPPARPCWSTPAPRSRTCKRTSATPTSPPPWACTPASAPDAPTTSPKGWTS